MNRILVLDGVTYIVFNDTMRQETCEHEEFMNSWDVVQTLAHLGDPS